VGVIVAVTGQRTVEWGSESASFMTEHRLEDHTSSVFELSDNFVAGYERNRDPVFEVERCAALDH
jgi:hypothetical protein